MKRKQQMSKNTRQTEKMASGSPYINRCGEYTIEAEFAGSSSLESCLVLPQCLVQAAGGQGGVLLGQIIVQPGGGETLYF